MKLFLVYDERAILGDTERAAVLETAKTMPEALLSPFEGVVFQYQIKNKMLLGEHLIGPTRMLQYRLDREKKPDA